MCGSIVINDSYFMSPPLRAVHLIVPLNNQCIYYTNSYDKYAIMIFYYFGLKNNNIIDVYTVPILDEIQHPSAS